jgi:hypothetical protein
MKAGWLGQMAGVALGAPTEFKFRGQLMPEERPKVKAIVVGPESSGNRWFAQVLRAHHGIGEVIQTSFPANPAPRTCWPKLRDFDPTGEATVFVMCRDSSVTKLAQKRHRNFEVHPGFTDLDEALHQLGQQIERWPGKVIFVSYETLVTWGVLYLKQIFDLAGLDHEFNFHVHFQATDGNARYFV